MQSFTFSELSERAQEQAQKNYAFEILAHSIAPIGDVKTLIINTLSEWRFTEHGERVA